MPVKRHPMAVAVASDSLSRVPLDVSLVTRLRATYVILQPNAQRLAELFYAKLFAAAPSHRSIFASDLSVQATKLAAALEAVVRNLENPRANIEVLSDLGRRHAGYGVTPEHYRLAIDCLLDAMRELGGNALEERSLIEWRVALRLIADQMIIGAHSE